MQLHEIRPKLKRKNRKRIGRGGKKGTYSGKGIKGQTSRTGHKLKPIIRELIKRYPKLRGYRFKGIGNNIAVVNLRDLENKFSNKELVSPETLFKKNIVKSVKGRVPMVKILSVGHLTKPLIFESCEISAGARKKIEKAKGIIKLTGKKKNVV